MLLKPRVAFIDGDVNIEYVNQIVSKKQDIKQILTINNGKVIQSTGSLSNALSHATLCSKVFFNHVTCDCEISYLNIWEEDEINANIRDLVKALSWCLENDIQLINLSLGTTRLADIPDLLTVTNQLIVKGVIIVAASSNQRKLTFPAAFEQVIGVKAIPENKKQKTGFIYHETSIDRIQISCYFSDEFLDYKEEYYYLGASNSLVAPIVSAKVCDLLSEGYNSLEEIKKQLKACSFEKASETLRKMYKKYFEGEIEIPVLVYLKGKNEHFFKDFNNYFANQNYHGICLSEYSDNDFLASVINIKNMGYPLMKKIRFYAHYCQADYLFIEVNNESQIEQLKFNEVDFFLHPSGFNISGIDEQTLCLLVPSDGDSTVLIEKIYHFLVD